MMMARTLLLGGLAVGFAMPAEAQTTSTTPPASSAARTDSTVVPAGELESGANSFTEGQVRSRLEENGFSAITGLRKDDNGFWRATATRGGTSGDVAFDFRGRIAHGPGVATVGPRPAGATTSTAPRDGTAGNPPGTAAGRATDRALGTNATGTNPTPSGTPANPPGTAAGRATDRALGTNTPDGTPGNPPGTAAGRAVDRTLGTNTTGANPTPPDGTPGNPPGTAAGRATDRALGTNNSGANPAPQR